MTTLNCDDLREDIHSGAILLDVRNIDEFSRGALPNAKNIPLAILPLLAHERLNRHEPLLVYCHGGGRAIIAEKILAQLGFTNVKNIGGIVHYQHCN
jgi:rhodanese-related sulfurtransferase